MSVILNILPQHMSHTLGMSTTVKDFVTVFVELFSIDFARLVEPEIIVCRDATNSRSMAHAK